MLATVLIQELGSSSWGHGIFRRLRPGRASHVTASLDSANKPRSSRAQSDSRTPSRRRRLAERGTQGTHRPVNLFFLLEQLIITDLSQCLRAAMQLQPSLRDHLRPQQSLRLGPSPVPADSTCPHPIEVSGVVFGPIPPFQGFDVSLRKLIVSFHCHQDEPVDGGGARMEVKRRERRRKLPHRTDHIRTSLVSGALL